MLRETHPRVGRHFEGTEFDQSKPPRRAVRRIKFVDADFRAMRVAGDIDKQIAIEAVDKPQGRRFTGAGRAGKRDFEFIELIVPCLIDARRLARRTDEEPREEIGKRRMPLPIEHQALEQVGPPQHG